jgi:malate permease and related proteins
METTPSFFSLFFAILPLFMIGILGVYFRKHGGMAIHADETILWLLINLFTPCLIVDSFLGNKALDNLGNIVVAPILGFSTVIIGIVVSAIAAQFLGLGKRGQDRTFIACVSLYNYGYIPIPIILLFFSKEILGMLFVYNVGLELAMWTVGYIVLTGKVSLAGSLKKAVTPPLAAIVLSLIANAWFTENPLPASLARVIHMIGQATIPMAMLLVGATVYDHSLSLKTIHPVKPILAAIFLRLFLIPLSFVAMAFFLPIPQSLKIVLCVQAGMPSAVLPIVLVRMYGGDLHLAVRIIVATSVLCLLTLPAWLAFSLGRV